MTRDRVRANEALFDAVAKRYDAVGFLAQAARFVAGAAAVQPGEAVLDVMTGTGAVAAEVVGRAGRVVGVDVSAGMLAQARARVPGAEFVRGDAAALPFPDLFGRQAGVVDFVGLDDDGVDEGLQAFELVIGCASRAGLGHHRPRLSLGLRARLCGTTCG